MMITHSYLIHIRAQENVSKVEERSMRNKINKYYQDSATEIFENHESPKIFVSLLK